MSTKKSILGLTPTQIMAVLGKVPTDIDPEHETGPINQRRTALDACLNGARRILDDPRKKAMFSRIYRGE